MPVWVDGDRIRLTQIADNLLSNAIKYTGAGGTITLSLQRRDEQAVMQVRDTGEGIEPELLPHIFEVFRQAAQSIDRSLGGMGLGLPLVKSLTELHGGSVEAHSDGRGRGAVFEVRLPLSHHVQTPEPDVSGDELQPRRVLLIEDNHDSAEALRRLLELAGHEVQVAKDGREGLAQAQNEPPPDVVLCDLGLPDGLSGFEVATRLRSDPRLHGVRMIAVSGYGRPQDKERSAAAGFDDHLTKPVDIATLKRLLQETEPPE